MKYLQRLCILGQFRHGGQLGADAAHGSLQAGASSRTVDGLHSAGEEEQQAEQLQHEQHKSHFEGSLVSRTSHQLDVGPRTVQATRLETTIACEGRKFEPLAYHWAAGRRLSPSVVPKTLWHCGSHIDSQKLRQLHKENSKR